MTIAEFFRMVLNVYTHAHGHAYILIHKCVHTPKQTSNSSLMTHILYAAAHALITVWSFSTFLNLFNPFK